MPTSETAQAPPQYNVPNVNPLNPGNVPAHPNTNNQVGMVQVL